MNKRKVITAGIAAVASAGIAVAVSGCDKTSPTSTGVPANTQPAHLQRLPLAGQ